MKERITASEFFEAYSRSEISLQEAMSGVQAPDYRSFLDGLMDSGYSLPQITKVSGKPRITR